MVRNGRYDVGEPSNAVGAIAAVALDAAKDAAETGGFQIKGIAVILEIERTPAVTQDSVTAFWFPEEDVDPADVYAWMLPQVVTSAKIAGLNMGVMPAPRGGPDS